MKKGIIIVVVLVLSYAILSFGNGMLGGSEDVTASGKETLTGTAEGFGGEVSVTVTTEGGKIVNVDVIGDAETPGIGTMAIDELPGKIVEANSADVEVVAGATYTSDAIIKAVKNALASSSSSGAGSTLTGTAEGFGGAVNVTLTMDGDKIVNVEVEGADETPGIGTMAIDELPGKIIEANSADVEVVAGATITSEAIIKAVNSALGK